MRGRALCRSLSQSLVSRALSRPLYLFIDPRMYMQDVDLSRFQDLSNLCLWGLKYIVDCRLSVLLNERDCFYLQEGMSESSTFQRYLLSFQNNFTLCVVEFVGMPSTILLDRQAGLLLWKYVMCMLSLILIYASILHGPVLDSKFLYVNNYKLIALIQFTVILLYKSINFWGYMCNYAWL